MEINGQTKLADILAEYPFMKTGMAEGFPVVDVRGAKGNFFPGLKARTEAVPVGEGLTVVQSFEPVPLYDVMEGLGFERATRKAADGEYRAYFYRAGEIVGMLMERFGEQNPDVGVQ